MEYLLFLNLQDGLHIVFWTKKIDTHKRIRYYSDVLFFYIN